MKEFDVGIIGAGVAGAFAAFKIANEHKDVKTIIFDLGRPPMKRRRQLEGWLGCLPNSDGKLYVNDLASVTKLTGKTKAYSYFTELFSKIKKLKKTKDNLPSQFIIDKLNNFNYEYYLNDFYQIHPKDVHQLSKLMSESIENNENITYGFDNEIQSVYKKNNMFIVVGEEEEYACKKLLIATGRSGWRWANKLYKDFGIISDNDTAKFGIRVEIDRSCLQNLNESHLSLVKNEIEVGPFSWNGTVIPEDHLDTALTAFRSNEDRWKSDKVSFSLMSNRNYPDNGFEQADRLAKLTFILTNDRVIKEKVSKILVKKSKLCIMHEYDWLKAAIEDLANVIPDITTKAYFHAPTIHAMSSKINIGSNLETEIPGMFVAGESAGIQGILAAAVMGIVAADSLCCK